MYKTVFKDYQVSKIEAPAKTLCEIETDGFPIISTGHSEVCWINVEGQNTIEVCFREAPKTITLFGQLSIYVNDPTPHTEGTKVYFEKESVKV